MGEGVTWRAGVKGGASKKKKRGIIDEQKTDEDQTWVGTLPHIG